MAPATLAMVTAIGGGTYALWSASAEFTGGTVRAGNLNVRGGTDAAIWYDVSPDRKDAKVQLPALPPGAIPGLAAGAQTKGHAIDLDLWSIVPGDTILKVMPMQVDLTGDNLVAGLSFKPAPNHAPWVGEGSSKVDVKFYVQIDDRPATTAGAAAGFDGKPFGYFAGRPTGGGDSDGNSSTYLVDGGGALDFNVLVVVSFADTVTDRDQVSEVIAALDGGEFHLTQVREVGAQFGA